MPFLFAFSYLVRLSLHTSSILTLKSVLPQSCSVTVFSNSGFFDFHTKGSSFSNTAPSIEAFHNFAKVAACSVQIGSDVAKSRHRAVLCARSNSALAFEQPHYQDQSGHRGALCPRRLVMSWKLSRPVLAPENPSIRALQCTPPASGDMSLKRTRKIHDSCGQSSPPRESVTATVTKSIWDVKEEKRECCWMAWDCVDLVNRFPLLLLETQPTANFPKSFHSEFISALAGGLALRRPAS